MRTSSLSLKGSSGTVARNRDNTHEESVIHIEPNDKGVSGTLTLRIPVERNEKGEEVSAEEQGLEPGDYNISISLGKARSVPADGNAPLLSESQVRAGETSTEAARRRRDVTGG